MTKLLRRKELQTLLQQAEDEKFKLKRELTAADLTLLGIGATVGVGIFLLPGLMAAKVAGPAIVVSFLLSAIACIFAGLCYAEFASLAPVSGSAYTYSYVALGEIFAWIIGWDLLLEFGVSMSAVAVGWSGYVTNLLSDLGIHLPKILTNDIAHGGIINLPAIFIIALLGWILTRGIRESSNFSNIMVFIKLAVIILFIVLAAPHIKPQNWTPFAPYGWKNVITAAGLVFFAYGGFDAVSTASEETKNPQRNIPIGLVASLTIVATLYAIVCLVLTGVVNYKKLDNSAPVAYVLSLIGVKWGSVLVAIGAVVGITTVMMVMLLGTTRILFSLSRDGLLPPVFSKVHKTRRTPYVATIAVTIIGILLSGFLPIMTLAELCNIGALFAFMLTSISVLVLRIKRPDIKRPFKVPAVYVIAPLAALISFGLIVSLPKIAIIRFIVWLAIGLIIYFSYGIKHSVVQNSRNNS